MAPGSAVAAARELDHSSGVETARQASIIVRPMLSQRSRHTAVGMPASTMSMRTDDGAEIPYEKFLRSTRYMGAFLIRALGGSGNLVLQNILSARMRPQNDFPSLPRRGSGRIPRMPSTN